MNEQQQETKEPMNDQKELNLPQLYSKMLILIFAMLFSVIFAAVLLMLNLRRLGNTKAAGYVLLFSVGYLIITAVILQIFSLDPGFTFVFNVIGAAILNEYFWNKYIGAETSYKKRSWTKPTMIALLIALCFFIILVNLGVQNL